MTGEVVVGCVGSRGRAARVVGGHCWPLPSGGPVTRPRPLAPGLTWFWSL